MCWDIQMRFLLIGSFTIFLISLHEKTFDKEEFTIGGSEALTMMSTLLIVCIIDSVTQKKCEDDIDQLTSKLKNEKIKVFRDGNPSA